MILVAICALGLNKLSILCFYRRIFCDGKRAGSDPYSLSTYGMIWLVALWTIAMFFSDVFMCKTHFWQIVSLTDHSSCYHAPPHYKFDIAADFTFDVVILILPIPLVGLFIAMSVMKLTEKVWQLQMPTSRKIAIILTFLLGITFVSTCNPQCSHLTLGSAVAASLTRLLWVVYNFTRKSEAQMKHWKTRLNSVSSCCVRGVYRSP